VATISWDGGKVVADICGYLGQRLTRDRISCVSYLTLR
jgi:hypothetical protein